MNGEIKVSAQKLRRRKKLFRISVILLILLFIILTIVYAAVSFVYNGYYFSITLDKDLYLKNKVVIYDDPNYKIYRNVIQVESLDFFDNISERWLPEDIDGSGGSHNGDSYLAYTFYIENMGDETVDFYNELIIDDVVKDIDEAIRFKIYYDGNATTYAKKSMNSTPENGTVAFKDKNIVVQQKVSNFKAGEIHKYTLVMWVEGNDPECTNNILGGELKAHFDFKSYHKEGRK